MKFIQRLLGSREGKPLFGRWVHPEPGDRSGFLPMAGGYTPERLRAIFDAANSGEIRDLALACREIRERNWDIQGALDQRAAALCGTEYDVVPGDDTSDAKHAAELFAKELRAAGRGNDLAGFPELVRSFADAVISPFAAAEIVWGEGGRLAGFVPVDAWHFSLRDGYEPRLISDEYPAGVPPELMRDKFVFHRFDHASDPAHSGKIRVLAWLHCFQHWPLKDLFSFIERFGMPFVVAKVDPRTWEEERSVLHRLIRSFGPSGGGVFTKSTELELLNAANTGGDNVYFRALEFTHDAIYTLLVGQLASSGDSSGMSNGNAQSAVRQDILESDARAVESTVLARISSPWTRWRFGEHVSPPEVRFRVQPPEDLTGLATIVGTLGQAGFRADPAELSAKFGLKLEYEPPAAAPANGFALSARSDRPDESTETGGDSKLAAALEEWLGGTADSIASAAELTDDELDRKLRSGELVRTNVPNQLENLMYREMHDVTDDTLQGR